MVKHPVIIIEGGGSNGLGIARNLGSVGIDVYCLTSNRFDLTIFSKYCKGFSVVSGIEVDPERLKISLKLLEKKLPRKGVLFPTGDNSLLTLSCIINELDNYISFIPDREIIETLVLKKKFYKSLKEHDVPHPMTLNTDEIDVNEIEGKIAFPVYIRPSQSAVFTKTFRRKGFVANTLGELRRYLQLVEKHEIDVMIQEIIPGPTSNGYVIRGYFDKHSKPIVLFAVQKIRKPSMFSDNCAKVSIPISQVADVCDTMVKYLTSLRYRGLFGVDCKRDPRDGRFKLLEINARSMGGNNFARTCGANDVLVAYRDTLGEEVKPVTHYDTGVYGINIIVDILTLLGLMHRGRLKQNQSSNILPYLSKKVWSRLSKDDFVPFIKSMQTYLR